MSDVPVQLIVAAFQDEKSANMALKELKRAKRERLIGIQNAAVLRKDQKGKLHIKETADMGGGKGAALGGVGGAAIGLISARTVKMTAMPQMVAAFNGFGGGASAPYGLTFSGMWVQLAEGGADD